MTDELTGHPAATPARPPKVLVGYATRMGSTREIAEAIATELGAAGCETSVMACNDAPSPREFDAVIIGSALYTRHW